METKPRVTRLLGGPNDGVVGETEGSPPPALAFGEAGGFVYTLVSDPRRRDKPLLYRYNPVLSPTHQLVVEADRAAVREVAETEGITIAEVLDRARRKRAAIKTGPKPAEYLFAEAERLGTTPEALLAEGFDISTLYKESR